VFRPQQKRPEDEHVLDKSKFKPRNASEPEPEVTVPIDHSISNLNRTDHSPANESEQVEFRTFGAHHGKLDVAELKQHLAEFKLPLRVCSIAFISPSLTPNGDVNPAFKIYSVDDTVRKG
jgi:hypothetical protein